MFSQASDQGLCSKRLADQDLQEKSCHLLTYQTFVLHPGIFWILQSNQPSLPFSFTVLVLRRLFVEMYFPYVGKYASGTHAAGVLVAKSVFP